MRQRGVAAWAFLFLLVAGCTQPTTEPPVRSTPPLAPPTTSGFTLPQVTGENRTVDPFELRPELVKCRVFLAALTLPAALVQAQVPAGYIVRGPTPQTAQVNVEAFACETAVLTNETILVAPSAAWTLARVGVNESLGGGTDVHFYALELFASDPVLVQLFDALGFAIHRAAIGLTGDEITTEAKISMGGEIVYALRGSNGAGAAINDRDWHRVHFVNPVGRVLWFNYNRTVDTEAFPGAGTVEVRGGALASIVPPDTVIGGLGDLSRSHTRIDFGRL